ncbi:hypothetical protein [Mycobacterium sp. PSTR-4-N]|uniref:hypothetical protein n=1 Tax=Mycobacterium sp. PSTR-4-N TaxID=2917745 RepID=UPI001F14CB97|nr:hypothetical protein [Mycobacterium sp. PSTR-4-N]MCG7594738.1 hypothetical protein [Mycobacterium sp. PSTR-4-N]
MTTPKRPVMHPAALSSNRALAAARADLHEALRADDEHRRQQYARSARDSAAEVLWDASSTRLECEYAIYYLGDAEAMIAATASNKAINPKRIGMTGRPRMNACRA